MDDRTEPVRWEALAEILSLMPGVPEQLLAEHTDAGCGRCRSLATLAVKLRGRRG